jgi:hypothetical protein
MGLNADDRIYPANAIDDRKTVVVTLATSALALKRGTALQRAIGMLS